MDHREGVIGIWAWSLVGRFYSIGGIWNAPIGFLRSQFLFDLGILSGRSQKGFRDESTAKGGNHLMPLVKIKEDETFENALRRFKRKCEKSGILSELKKRQHYEKPSAKRKRKMLAARKKSLKRLSQERRIMGTN